MTGELASLHIHSGPLLKCIDCLYAF